MNEIPIIENNHEEEDIITPSAEYEYELKFSERKEYPENCFIFFQPEIMDKFTKGMELKLLDTFLGSYNFYKTTHKGKSFGVILFKIKKTLSSLLIERLIIRGVKKFITVGISGSLSPRSKAGEVYLCSKSIRDEGTSYHYLKPSKYAEPSKTLNDLISKQFSKDEIEFSEGITWTTDAGYKESKEKAKKYGEEGVICIDMESASLFAIASHRKVDLSSIFILSDFTDKDLNWNPEFHDEEILNSAEKIKESLISALLN
jgi:uridine phosphorylase